MSEKLIREPEFAARFTQACDQNPNIPALNRGRLIWIKRAMKERFDEDVSTESIRKWFSGETKPRQENIRLLAILLDVSKEWLTFGTNAPTPREQKIRNAVANGAVNVVAGFIQMAGGNPAFPREGDSRAQESMIDLYAIIKGVQYAFHVTLGEKAGDVWKFSVPSNHSDAVQLGVMKVGPTCIEIIEISDTHISKGARRGGTVDVQIPDTEAKLAVIEDLGRRL